MKSTFKKFALLGTLIFGLSAQAGVLIEPYLGYATGKTKQTTLAGETSNSTSGPIYGARLGFQQLGFMGGLDYMSGKLKTDPSSDVTPSDLGIFVGFNFPIMLRVYGVYNFQSKATATTSGSDAKAEGHGIKLGVGFTALPLVSINLEYLADTFTKLNGSSLSNSINTNTIGVTVSLPFDL